jgi:hypothetical protein
MSEKKHPRTDIVFEEPGIKGEAPTISINGVPSDQLKRREKILKLMDLLELPEGTNARVVFSAEDVIVR